MAKLLPKASIPSELLEKEIGNFMLFIVVGKSRRE
jgi:hypothetical protein